MIELMTAVAIIAMLVAIALPAYRDYVVRTRVSEALSLSETYKMAVSENIVNGANPDDPAACASTEELEVVASNVASMNCSHGEIIIVTTAPAGSLTLKLTPSRNIATTSWSCTLQSGKEAFVPRFCRN